MTRERGPGFPRRDRTSRATESLLAVAALALGVAACGLELAPPGPPPLPHELKLLLTESQLRFVAIQNGELAVAGSLRPLAGALDTVHRTAWIELALASVDTGDSERDENLRDHVFEVEKFPSARIVVTAAEITRGPPDASAPPAIGEAIEVDVRADLELRGGRYPIKAELRITREAAGRVRVATRAPVLFSARSTGLTAGFTLLEVIGRIESVSRVVPVEVDLVFQAPAS